MRNQLVIGLGTGRCGTVSLAQLLGAQPGSYVTHEISRCPWTFSRYAAETALSILAPSAEAAEARPASGGWGGLVGDVAFYYLPYVTFFLERHPDARFVCLRRDRAATIASYLKKSGARNHWTKRGYVQRDTGSWVADPLWDPCFPKYAAPKEEALGRYYDDYYARAEELARAFPEAFRVFPTDDLNSLAGVDRILDFVGVPAPRRLRIVGVRRNVETRADRVV